MYELKGKILPLALIIVLVIIIMLSNFGQNFKNDIFSYSKTIDYSNEITSIWDESKNYQEYIDTSSAYISDFLKAHNIAPLYEEGYSEEWSLNIPVFKYESSLEVVSIYGRIIKKYQYGVDFFEDFRGSIKSGIVKNKAYYLDSINLENKTPRQIILYEGYKNKSPDEIYNLDSTLRTLGTAGVISPSYSGDLKYESNLYELNNQTNNGGLVKFIVSQSAFNELKEFANKGYTIKIKSGADIKSSSNKNIYGVIKGRNRSYKPLILAVYFDGIIKTGDATERKFEYYTLSTSMILEAIEALKLQRMRSPDRTIIFAFLSNKSFGKEGLNKLIDKDLEGDIVVFDGIGTDSSYSLSYTRQSKTLNDTLKYFLEKNNLGVSSKNLDMALEKNLVTILNNNFNDGTYTNFQQISNSGKFILSLIGDECYNLDILSGNVRQVRAFKRFVRGNSVVLSLAALISLIFIVFKKPSIKSN